MESVKNYPECSCLGSLRKEAYKAEDCPVDKPKINKRSSKIRELHILSGLLPGVKLDGKSDIPTCLKKFIIYGLRWGSNLIGYNEFDTI